MVAADAMEVMAPPLAMLSALLNANDGTDEEVAAVASDAAADENVMMKVLFVEKEEYFVEWLYASLCTIAVKVKSRNLKECKDAFLSIFD